MYDHLTEEERQMGARKLRQLLDEARAEVERLDKLRKQYEWHLSMIGSRLFQLNQSAREGLPPSKEVRGCDWLEASWVEWMIQYPLMHYEMYTGHREMGDFETGKKDVKEMQQRHEWSYSQDLRERERRIKDKERSRKCSKA